MFNDKGEEIPPPLSQQQIKDIVIGGQKHDNEPMQVEKNKNTQKKQVFYSEKDSGPFLVMLESTEQSGNNVGKYNHLKLAKEIFELKLNDIKKITNKGINRLGVEFVNYKTANNFVKNDALKKKGYNIFIPYNQVTCKGIVRHIDIQFNENEIKAMCVCPQKIVEIRRLNRKQINSNKEVQYVPTGTVLFTFEGKILPRYIELYALPMPVSPYISPVTQCFACLLFGHTKNQCRGKVKCFTCGSNSHENNNEEETQCTIKCYHCKSNEHKSTSKNCPEYVRQKAIKQLMAFENLNYFEASNQCPKTYTNENDFTYRPQEFPTLTKKSNTLDNNINVSQRRIIYNESNLKTKRSYQQAINTPAKRKLIEKNTGYDKENHNSQLYFPNSRPNRQTKLQTQNQNNTPYSALQQPININKRSTTQETYTNTNNNTDRFQDIFSQFILLPDEQKEKMKDLILTHIQISQNYDFDMPMNAPSTSNDDSY